MRVLFVLGQRPDLTGSGITLDALVREARAAGHEVSVLCGMPAGEPVPAVGGLDPAHVGAVTFGEGGELPYPIPGMSDVMPYPSTVWSEMTDQMLARYREVWRTRLTCAVAATRPDVVHCNHLWLMSSLAPEVLGTPSVAHCHATGLRQLQLCPHLRAEVAAGLRRHDAFLVLHAEHARQVSALLPVPRARIHDVGAGYRTDLFHARGAPPPDRRRGHLLYVGKFAAAKGLPWLLDACELLWQSGASFTLHVAGDGGGAEAEQLRTRMAALAPRVQLHGRLDQPALADVMRRCAGLVLPSFYEGLPLVLAEARACGCLLLSTALPGVTSRLAPALGEDLQTVPLPGLVGPDTPVAADLPDFTVRLAAALGRLAALPAREPEPDELAPFTWQAVFLRVERVWREVAARRPRG